MSDTKTTYSLSNLPLVLLQHILSYFRSTQDIRNMQTYNKVIMSSMGIFKSVRLSSVLKYKIPCKHIGHLVVDINRPLRFIHDCILDTKYKQEFRKGFPKIQTLQFDDNFNQIFGTFEYELFLNVKNIIFGDLFNQALTHKFETGLPRRRTKYSLKDLKHLKYLIFGESFKKDITKHNIKFLTSDINNYRYHEGYDIHKDNSHLTFAYSKQHLKKFLIPLSITYLKIHGLSYGQDYIGYLCFVVHPNITTFIVCAKNKKVKV